MNTESVSDLRPISSLLYRAQSLLQRSLGGLFDALSYDITTMIAQRREWIVMVVANADGINVFHQGREAAIKVAAIRNELSEADLAVLRQVRPAEAGRDNTIFRLATDKVIIREVVLPGAAAKFVPAIIRNKIERLAPWPLKEALFGYRIEANSDAAGQIKAKVAITGRRMVEGTLANLAKAGIVPGRVEFAEGPYAEDPIVLLSMGSDLEQKVAQWLRLGLVGLVSLQIIATALTTISVSRAWRDLAAAEAKIADLKANLAVTAETDRTPATLVIRDKAILRKQTEQSLSAILLALTKALPDESWLIDLSYRDPEITVTGRSQLVPPLIKALESGPIFTDVNFAAPTRREADEAAAAFSIKMTVLPGSEDAAWE